MRNLLYEEEQSYSMEAQADVGSVVHLRDSSPCLLLVMNAPNPA